MTSLDTTVVRAALLDETDRLAELYLDADPATPIPTCPDWTLANLVAHVGGGHRWAAAMITDRATEFLDFAQVPEIRRPREVAAAAAWLREGARVVIDAIDATGPEVPVWTPFSQPRPSEWWVRRRLHETTAHRADALLALGREVDLDPALAADGISELLGLMAMGSPRFGTPLDEGITLSLHATDDADHWRIRRSGSVIEWDADTAPTTAELAATAADLFLVLLRRIPVEQPRVRISGDPSVVTTWLERTAF
ncbi:maleylpyruvate isomerase family mycothiol-dependent enzyme [Nocardia sp. CDC159]|uniref:Maleylpyruvate isomerase family mycothiol-dependent enzyme n=1 Tax=Nocardia pulmonis TaxID=2951408 RepID=A0A9X2E4Z7_9NOCA|nr:MULTISPECIES: maleylpyruvate isomerase family mycothiol-dependent enzyme [Nocardia]MCM6773735.1 maleylpyruvate isomerase family mycothiol-dependent enzyme [Nocardia pulmonis]MCM6786622.1 maleylpyruvate isomerase family mycothiol-dependent enzyme [Nocardia sp. CDC159]